MKINATLFLLSYLLITSSILAAPSVQVQGLFQDKALLQIDGKQYLLRKGQSSPEGVTLISASSRQAVLSIGGKRQTLGLGSQIGGQFQKPQRVTEILSRHNDGMYYSEGSINGQPIQFMIDTGATSIAINRNDAKRLGIPFRWEGQETVTSTASGYARSFVVTLGTVRVGRIELRNVKAIVIDSDFPDIPLLGMSFLNQLNMQRRGNSLMLIKTH